jgi:hypothetical protein
LVRVGSGAGSARRISDSGSAMMGGRLPGGFFL